MFTNEHIKRVYVSKCRKYPPEEIMFDLELKNQLYKEAVNEVNTMAYVSLKEVN